MFFDGYKRGDIVVMIHDARARGVVVAKQRGQQVRVRFDSGRTYSVRAAYLKLDTSRQPVRS